LLLGALVISAAVIGFGVALDSDFTLELFPDKSLAKCLDGTPAGFYIRHSPSKSSSWIVHFEGGGMCFDEETCVQRSQSLLGSSKTWPTSPMDDFDGGSHGLFSTDPAVNPDFHDWNMVRVQYCDGSLYAGDRVEPYNYNGTDLFMRGRYIVEESIKTLKKKFHMSHAKEVIITGCSAGGVGVYLHLDWIREHIPKHVRVVGAPDSGFFLDIPNYKGQYNLSTVDKNAFDLHNATFVDADCSKKMSTEDQYKCAGSQYGATFVETPMFVMNSLSDAYQLQHTLMLDCFQNGSLTNCSEDESEAIDNFRLKMINDLKTDVLSKPGNGAFLPTCLTHCGACTDLFWDKTMVHSFQLQQAFGDWYFERTLKTPIIIDGPWPSNACGFLLSETQ